MVGTLLDWPLGARVVELLALPQEARNVACYQVVGTHGAAVETTVFHNPEVSSAVVAQHEEAILGTLELCTTTPGVTSTYGFHGSMTVPALREVLGREFTVLTPSDALASRRAKPAASRKRIEKALKDASIGSRKALYAFLDGGPFKESLTNLDGHYLSYGCVTGVEVHNDVEARLAFVWCHCASRDTMPPMPKNPELGFDRFGLTLDALIRAGTPAEVALDHLLVRKAQYSRWWPSTGVYVWERLLADAEALSRSALDHASGQQLLADMLMSVLWLPEGVLAAGAAAVVRDVCRSSALVPDRTIEVLREDEKAARSLEGIERPPGTQVKASPQKVTSRADVPLAPFTTVADVNERLARYLASTSRADAIRPDKPRKTTKVQPRAAARRRATESNFDEVVEVAHALLDMAPGKAPKPATKAQVAKIEVFLGRLPVSLAAFYGVASNWNAAFAGQTDGSLLSLAQALKTSAELSAGDDADRVFALFDDHGGNFVCLDPESERAVFWDHETRGTTDYASTLAGALRKLARLRERKAKPCSR